MKKTFVIWLSLSLALSVFGQENGEQNEQGNEIALEGVTISSLNADYLNKIQDDDTPDIVKKLEYKAASYDIKTSPVYDGVREAYEVFFKNSRGRIVATYDNDGKILTSFEKFRDLRLPVLVRDMIGEEFPGWKIESDVYLASYYQEKDVKKVYIITMSHGDKIKKIRTDEKGRLL